MECVVPIATLTTLTTSIRSSTTVVYGVVETVLSTTRDMISTGTVEATGRPMTASTRSRQSAWNTTSSRSTSLLQAAPTGYPTVGLSNTGNASSNHPASAVNGSTMTLVVPVIEPTTTTRTTSLSTSTGGSLELPQTIVPLTSPGSCSNSAATA
jgi:hypothetical protein